jgi:protein NirF
MKHLGFLVGALLLAAAGMTAAADLRGTGDLGIVVERAVGRVQVIDSTQRAALTEVPGLGDLSHASAVFSRDARYAYVFGRDGGLNKVDLLAGRLERRIVQAGNSIGGAISQDGKLIAVSNYEPGGVRVFDADTLDPVADIPTNSKVVGLVDAPNDRFVFSLYDLGEIWVLDVRDPAAPAITKYPNVGRYPYDALITPDGRYYMAGLFGEDGLGLLDLWHPEAGVRRILDGYGRGEAPLPVYKMPHLEGVALAGRYAFLPAVGRHELLIVDIEQEWREVSRIPVHGQPVFAVTRPDGRQIWVNFAHPDNDTVQVIDAVTLKVVHAVRPGPAVLHLEFTPRGEQVWISVRDADRVDIYDTRSFERLGSLPADKPSGIFMTARAHRIGY